jgi:hypothetical protein
MQRRLRSCEGVSQDGRLYVTISRKYLDRKRVCTQVLERQLESLGAVVERDLDGDEGILIHWACG